MLIDSTEIAQENAFAMDLSQKGKRVLYPIHTAREEKPLSPKRKLLYEIIFEAETPMGQAFDVALLIAILLSVLAVLLESVAKIQEEYGTWLYGIEWFFTLLFTLEYGLRLSSVMRPHRYALSFFGIIDLLAIIPTFLSFFFVGAQSLLVIRVLRLLRLFRVFKLTRYMGEARFLVAALKASRYKITVFLLTVTSVVVIMGALMYLIEGPASGFTSIPRGIYWSIVTMTTVGYGDIAPQSIVGQTLAAVLMIMGYGIIAVPTGIVTVELAQTARNVTVASCRACGFNESDSKARFCRLCGKEYLPQ
jgi:voltage-gated potassium channel